LSKFEPISIVVKLFSKSATYQNLIIISYTPIAVPNRPMHMKIMGYDFSYCKLWHLQFIVYELH